MKYFEKEKIIWLSVFVFGLFPLLPEKIKGLPVILLFLASLLSYDKKRGNTAKLLINSSLILAYLISLIYTENMSAGLKKIETSLAILALPLAFYFFNLKIPVLEYKKLKNIFLKTFVLSSSVYSLCIGVAYILDSTTTYYKDWFSNKFRIVVEKMPLIGEHPIYASIFLSLAVLFSLNLIFEKKLKETKQVVIFSLALFICLAMLIILASKGVIISLAISATLFVLRQNIGNKIRIALVLSIILGLISLFMVNRRMKEMVNFETYGTLNENFSNSIRVNIYDCSFNVIAKGWLIGYGVGDSQDILESCYPEKSELLLKNTYNAHNQFLDVTIKLGIVGLFMFLLFLACHVKWAFIEHNDLKLTVLMFYIVNFMSESILVRQSGIILFYFLILFLGLHVKTRLQRS